MTISSLGTFLFAKSETFHWYLSDENIYYCLARNLGADSLPYRDFFYANPPLLLILLKILGTVSNWSPFGLRVVPILATLVSGWLVIRMLGRLGTLSLVPLWVFLFSYIDLRASTHATGINVTLMFVFLAYALVLVGRIRFGALCLCFGLWTKFYAVTALPGLLVAIFLTAGERRKKRLLEFLGIFFASKLLLGLLGSLLGGKSFWQMNIGYHLSKTETETQGLATVFFRLFDQNRMSFVVFILCLLLAVISFVRGRKGGKNLELPPEIRRWFWVGGVHFAAVLMFLGLQKRVFDFYFLLFLPGIIFLMGGLLGVIRSQQWGRTTRIRVLSGTAMLGLSAVLLAQPILPFEWRVFMRDRSTDPVSYWDHERRHLDTLVEWARELNLPPGTTVCGDSATAPILALAADFRIALAEADTNVMRFRAGLPSPEAFIVRLEEQEVDTLLVRTSPRSGGKEGLNGIFILPEFQTYMKGSFQTRATLEVDSHTKVYLLARKPRNE